MDLRPQAHNGRYVTRQLFTPVRAGLLQRKCACGGMPGPTGECEECCKKRLQRKIGNPAYKIRNESVAPPIVHEVLRAPGQPLDAATQAFMEPRVGHDFSRIPVLTKQPQSYSESLVIGAAHDQYERE